MPYAAGTNSIINECSMTKGECICTPNENYYGETYKEQCVDGGTYDFCIVCDLPMPLSWYEPEGY